MAHVAVADLGSIEKEQLICTYAALLLGDAGLEISADKIKKVVKSSGNSVCEYMPAVFASALEHHDINDLVANVGAMAGSGGGAPAAAAAGDAPAAAKKEEKVEE